MPSGRCSIDQAAQRLGVERRTVHRRLAREGQTFSAILDAVRSELVTRYIKDSDRTLSVVGDMLGFSASSVLSRWFRGKFGCSVSAWRASQG